MTSSPRFLTSASVSSAKAPRRPDSPGAGRRGADQRRSSERRGASRNRLWISSWPAPFKDYRCALRAAAPAPEQNRRDKAACEGQYGIIEPFKPRHHGRVASSRSGNPCPGVGLLRSSWLNPATRTETDTFGPIEVPCRSLLGRADAALAAEFRDRRGAHAEADRPCARPDQTGGGGRQCRTRPDRAAPGASDRRSGRGSRRRQTRCRISAGGLADRLRHPDQHERQ